MWRLATQFDEGADVSNVPELVAFARFCFKMKFKSWNTWLKGRSTGLLTLIKTFYKQTMFIPTYWDSLSEIYRNNYKQW